MGNWSSKGVVLPPIEFDGDSITFTVKRLLVEDMMVLSKHFNQKNGALQFESPLEVCQTAQSIFPKYVQGINGMLDEDGKPVTVEGFVEATKEFYFVPLIGELFTSLLTVSTVKAQAKNSAPLSVASSEA